MSSRNIRDPKTSARQASDPPYRQILESVCEVLEDRAGPQTRSFFSVFVPWLFRRNGILFTGAHTLLRKLCALVGLNRAMPAALRLLRGLSLLSFALLVGLVPAVALTWLWWYVRRHCIQLVYRLLL